MDKKAIAQAQKMVKCITSLDGYERHYGKTRLTYGRGERYGNTPVEYSFIFSIGDKFFHFFTADMRYPHYGGLAYIRTCEHGRDFTGGNNHRVDDVEELKAFLRRKGVEV